MARAQAKGKLRGYPAFDRHQPPLERYPLVRQLDGPRVSLGGSECNFTNSAMHTVQGRKPNARVYTRAAENLLALMMRGS